MAAANKAPLSRTDVVSEVAAETELSQAKADQVIKAFENSLMRALTSGSEVRMAGFGTFGVSARAARVGRNPQTGESLKIAASKNVRFKAGKALKDALNSKGGSKGGAAKAGVAKAGASKGAASKGGAAKGAAKGGASKTSGLHKAAVTLGRAGSSGAGKGAAKGGSKGGRK